MKHPGKNFRLIVSLALLFLGGLLFHALAPAQSPPSPANPQKQILFEDKFERDEVGELYEVLEPDPNRLTINDGKLLIVATNPPKNLVLAQKTFSGDFVATVPMTMQVTKGNRAGLYYWVDEQNGLFVGVRGGEDEKIGGGYEQTFRGLIFSKKVGGQENTMQLDTLQLGKRQLKGESPAPELWYIQLEARYPLDAATLLLKPAGDGYVHGTEAYQVDLPSMQGATAIGRKFYVSSSRGADTPGSLYTFTKSSGPTEHAGALPPGPEDLSYWASQDQLWTLAEHPGNRSVLAANVSAF